MISYVTTFRVTTFYITTVMSRHFMLRKFIHLCQNRSFHITIFQITISRISYYIRLFRSRHLMSRHFMSQIFVSRFFMPRRFMSRLRRVMNTHLVLVSNVRLVVMWWSRDHIHLNIAHTSTYSRTTCCSVLSSRDQHRGEINLRSIITLRQIKTRTFTHKFHSTFSCELVTKHYQAPHWPSVRTSERQVLAIS